MRGFTSFVSLWTFLILAVTGIFMYITPSGRIANWSDWTMLGLTKEGWSGLHTIVSILFLLTIFIHIYFNWRVLVNYIKTRAGNSFRLKKEFALSLALTGLFFIGSVLQASPFWQVMEWNEQIKDYWEVTYTNPPVPHAEEMTLTELAGVMNVEETELITTLKNNNIIIPESGASLGEIAEYNEMTPNGVFAYFNVDGNVVNGLSEHGMSAGGGGGYGLMTIARAAENSGMTPNEAVLLLKAEKILVSSEEETLKSIAEKHNIRPFELIRILQEQ